MKLNDQLASLQSVNYITCSPVQAYVTVKYTYLLSNMLVDAFRVTNDDNCGAIATWRTEHSAFDKKRSHIDGRTEYNRWEQQCARLRLNEIQCPLPLSFGSTTMTLRHCVIFFQFLGTCLSWASLGVHIWVDFHNFKSQTQ